jgi:hypothetical protein
MDSMDVRPLFFGFDFTNANSAPPDTNYGLLPYGQFTDQPLWQEFRQVIYFWDVPVTAPGAAPTMFTASVTEHDEMSAAPATVAPILGPVTAPRIEGRDLLVPQSGVGLQPTISWSPPSLGTTTSVVVDVEEIYDSGGVTGSRAVLTATVRSSNSFRFPQNLLASGKTYIAILTAWYQPGEGLDAPLFGFGAPYYSTDRVTSTFTP